MLLIVFDIINSLFQSVFTVWVCNSIAVKEKRIGKFEFIILCLCIFIDIEVFTFSKINPPVANFIMAINIIILVLLFYRRSVIDALWGFALSCGYMIFISYVLSLLYKIIITNLDLKMPNQIQVILCIYTPLFLLYIVFYTKRKQILNCIIILKNLKHSNIIIQIIDFILIFINTLQGEWITINMIAEIRRILMGIFILVCILSIIYFFKINYSSKRVEILNKNLNNKILELRRIKNDYLDQMNNIYSFYKHNKYDELGEVIKYAIDKNQTGATADVSGTDKQNPIITAVLNQAIFKGVNVIVIDQADYEKLNINENEFLKLLSNIVNNAIDAMAEIPNPIIKFRSYNNINGITIIIGNNGPKVADDIIDKIFNTGFSTKENTSYDHGFGLSIVKDIINRSGGNIFVESDNQWTNFKMNFPSIK